MAGRPLTRKRHIPPALFHEPALPDGKDVGKHFAGRQSYQYLGKIKGDRPSADLLINHPPIENDRGFITPPLIRLTVAAASPAASVIDPRFRLADLQRATIEFLAIKITNSFNRLIFC